MLRFGNRENNIALFNLIIAGRQGRRVVIFVSAVGELQHVVMACDKIGLGQNRDIKRSVFLLEGYIFRRQNLGVVGQVIVKNYRDCTGRFFCVTINRIIGLYRASNGNCRVIVVHCTAVGEFDFGVCLFDFKGRNLHIRCRKVVCTLGSVYLHLIASGICRFFVYENVIALGVLLVIAYGSHIECAFVRRGDCRRDSFACVGIFRKGRLTVYLYRHIRRIRRLFNYPISYNLNRARFNVGTAVVNTGICIIESCIDGCCDDFATSSVLYGYCTHVACHGGLRGDVYRLFGFVVCKV